jgi:uncharacterized protein (TIGR00730 family)
LQDFRSKDTWRVFRIMGEFVEGFETLQAVQPAVSVFGGVRIGRRSPYYRKAVRIAELLAGAGYSIITGGGPGLMEAANLGAQKGGGKSIGLCIRLPEIEPPNRYLDTQLTFDYFFARKVMFVKYACAYVVLPGGFGTMDEVFEALTLIQTNRIRDFPIVLVGKSFWKGMLGWLRRGMLQTGTIGETDLDLLSVTDDPEEVCRIITTCNDRKLLANR